jgi:hypothetical protein
MLDLVGLPVSGSMCKKCTYSILFKLSGLENTSQVFGNYRPLSIEELGNLVLREPERFLLQLHVDLGPAIRALINDDFSSVHKISELGFTISS